MKTSSAIRRYAAFLRGVTPMNAKMSELKKCFENAGFTDVRTVLSSGNVVFGARSANISSLQKKAESAMAKRIGRSFITIVRPINQLRRLLAVDPYSKFRLSPNATRIVTFLREPKDAKISLPIEHKGARILCKKDGAILGAYLPGPHGPVFMTLLEKTFGKQITTLTWDTVKKVAK